MLFSLIFHFLCAWVFFCGSIYIFLLLLLCAHRRFVLFEFYCAWCCDCYCCYCYSDFGSVGAFICMCARRKDEDKQRVGDQVSDHRQNFAGINMKICTIKACQIGGINIQPPYWESSKFKRHHLLICVHFFLFALECVRFFSHSLNIWNRMNLAANFPNNKHVWTYRMYVDVHCTYLLTALARIYASRFKMPQVCFFNHNFVLYMRTLMSNFYGHSFYLKSNDTLAKSKSIWFNSYLRSFLKILVKRLQ